MDPLYANYDKRKKTLDENSAPVPQPTPNSMPVFGAAAAPTPKPVSEPEPEAELVIDHSPAAPEPAPEPIAAPTPAVEPTPQPAPVQNPFETQQQPTAFEQQFEQMIDGAAPAQLSQPQPQFNPNYTGTGDIVLNLDQPKKKINTKIIAIIAGIVVVTVLAVVLIAMGGGNKGGVTKNNKQDITSFVEYFVFGTEGENEVTDESLNADSEKFAFYGKINVSDYAKSLEYENNLIGKKIKNEDLKQKISVYGEISRMLYTDNLLVQYADEKIKKQEATSDSGSELLLDERNNYKKLMMDFYSQLDNECEEEILECYSDDSFMEDFIEENIELVKKENKMNKTMKAEKEELYSEIIVDVQNMWRGIK